LFGNSLAFPFVFHAVILAINFYWIFVLLTKKNPLGGHKVQLICRPYCARCIPAKDNSIDAPYVIGKDN
jgi:hypothetical protein